MAIRRHAMNPARVKVGFEGRKSGDIEKVSPCGFSLHRHLSVVLLNILSVALFLICFAPFDVWCFRYVGYAAFFALVPWALCLFDSHHPRRVLIWSYLAGFLFWAANLHWLWWITLPGYFAVTLFLGLMWLIAGLVIRSAFARGLPAWIILPVTWVSLEYLRAHLMSGFPWFYLAHSQYTQIRLIQIVDATGQYGISFFVAMVNGLIIDVLASFLFGGKYRARKPVRRILTGTACCVLSLAGMLGYGQWRISQKTTSEGPVTGVVQHAFPLSLTSAGASREKIFQDHLDITRDRLMGTGCDWVIWPEAVLSDWANPEMQEVNPATLKTEDLRSLGGLVLGREAIRNWSDEEIAGLLKVHLHTGGFEELKDGSRKRFYSARERSEKLSALVRKLGCPLLAGGGTGHRNALPVDMWDRWVVRNSALWYSRDGRVESLCSKQHMVPFGESAPFKRSWPWLYRRLRQFIPPSMPQIEPGGDCQPFVLKKKDGSKTWRIATAICFEGTFAHVCRKKIMRDGKKNADILVNISNDGWFVWRWGDGPYRGSTEHAQHMVHYVFRAIENRVPVIRSVNTGISASIDSNGRRVSVLQMDDNVRTMIAGTLLLDGYQRKSKAYLSINGPQVLVDDRVSLYSIVGDAFAMAVSLVAIVLVAWMIIRRRGSKKDR